MTDTDNRYLVPALERGLRLLQLFSRERTELTAPEIARELELPRASVFRIVQTLEGMGFLERHGNAYRLGPAVLRLGFEYLASLELTEIARPLIERLRDEADSSAQLVVRDGREAVVVLKAASPSMFASNVSVGTRFPAHATILGRALLSELDEDALKALFPESRLKAFSANTPKTVAELKRLLAEDRKRGYVLSESFFERGISAIAAPVRDEQGAVVAAVSTTVQRPTLDPKEYRERLVALVVKAAADLSHRLNFRPEREAA
jgi:DNA-binding IclR family transcriptional regulator